MTYWIVFALLKIIELSVIIYLPWYTFNAIVNGKLNPEHWTNEENGWLVDYVIAWIMGAIILIVAVAIVFAMAAFLTQIVKYNIMFLDRMIGV